MTAESLKLFHLNKGLLGADLRELETTYGLKILPDAASNSDDRDELFYPQFPEEVRKGAREMAQHYEIFYCLENWIRDQVRTQLQSVQGDDWWENCVPDTVRENVERNIARERDAAVSARSTEPIDYTTFGELSVIIDKNWDDFGELFNSRRGVTTVLSRLNVLRGPIAHCSALAEDEVLRLRLSLRDWFRLME